MHLVPSSAYRIRAGETVQVQVFSNVVMSLVGSFRVVYDDGSDDDLRVPTFVTGAGNLAQYPPTTSLAESDGYVVGGVVYIAGSSANQPVRGQTYVRAFTTRSAGLDAPALDLVMEGNLYRAFGVSLGQSEERAWMTWVYIADITNDGSNSGNHIYEVTPGAGNEMKILYGYLYNGDSSSRVGNVRIHDVSGQGSTSNLSDQLADFVPIATTLGAGQRGSFPTNDEFGDNTAAVMHTPFRIAGDMTIWARLASVAINQDSQFSIVCRIRGGIPAVVLTSPTDAVEVVHRNQVF